MSAMDKKVKSILMHLIETLAPEDMPKGEIAKLREATGLGESTIRTARKRERISADTLVRLLLAQGIDEQDIINLPRKKPSKICPSLTEWNKLGLSLSKTEREAYTEFVKWNKTRFKAIDC